MKIDERTENAKKVLEQNKEAVKINYNHIKIANELANYLHLNKYNAQKVA